MQIATSRMIHRATGGLIALFAASHLLVHLTAVLGTATHGAMLRAARTVYGHPIGEVVLVLAIAVQAITGLSRLKLRGSRGWRRLQSASGVTLLVFLILHTSAALYTRHLFGLETDFYWVAGSLHFHPIKYGFAVYYFVAVVALFVHIAAAAHVLQHDGLGRFRQILPMFGVVIACIMLITFSGLLYPVELPEGVRHYYEVNFGPLGVRR